MSAKHTPGRTFDELGRRLIELRRLGRLERKEFGAVSERTQGLIREAIAQAEAAVVIDDIAKATGSAA